MTTSEGRAPNSGATLPRSRTWPTGALILSATVGAIFGYLLGRNSDGPVPPVQVSMADAGPVGPPPVCPPAGTAWPAQPPVVLGAGLAPQRPRPPQEASEAQVKHRAASEVAVSVERIRSQLVSACWNELHPPPARRSTTVLMEVTIDASGRAMARSIDPSSDDDDRTVVSCLQRADIPLTLTPPGERVIVTVPFTLP